MKNILYVISACLFSLGIYAQNDTLVKQAVVFPEPTGYVTDTENLFSPNEIGALEVILEEFMASGKGVIAVATIKDIAPYDDFKTYTLDLSNYWGVGHKAKDNGLTIILSSNLRNVHINTGNGTQKIISDTFCEGVIANMIPYFKKAEYYVGLRAAILEIITEWQKH